MRRSHRSSDFHPRVLGLAAALFLATTAFSGSPAFSGSMEVDAVRDAKTLPPSLSVVGVVAKRNAGRSEFALIDRAEFARCVQVGCASFYLPVKWKGSLPSLASTVTVTGTVQGTKDGKYLVAQSVEVLRK